MMCTLIFIGFVLAFVSPLLYRALGRAAGWVFAIWPAFTLVSLLRAAPDIAAGIPVTDILNWIPNLNVALSFRVDGLSLLFACMITGIGTLILIYTSAYMAGNARLGRFYMYLILFMVAMVGTVCSDNLIMLYMFWELTGISSYLLIGFNHEEERSRDSALQALLVTGGGGLAMLAGFVIMGVTAGTFCVSELPAAGPVLRESAIYLPMLILILLGSFAKSAQMPLHIWLPNAMVAPTPVSAYLHSSTMVKLGVFLLARLTPVLGGTAEWQGIVTFFGGLTMIGGALLALPQTDLKRILAYSTISVLGLLIMLIGVGTPAALTAMCLMMLAHALYKGALFMVAGAVDHEAGTRNVLDLGGLRSKMPFVAGAAVISALSMAGIIPLFGFVAKEFFYESMLDSPVLAQGLTALCVLASALLGCCAAMAAVWPFFGAKRETPKHAHNGPLALWLGPVVLASLSLILGLFPNGAAHYILGPASAAMTGKSASLHLGLWHGVSTPLFLSIITVAIALAAFLMLTRMRKAGRLCRDFQISFGPNALYFKAIEGLFDLAATVARFFQNGYLRIYVMVMAAAGAIAIIYGLISGGPGFIRFDLSGVRFYEVLLAVAMIIAAITAAIVLYKLRVVVALSVTGYGMGVVYILYGAPDLAMTQFAIESLSLILLVFIIYRTPPISAFSSRFARVRDAIISLAFGAAMTGIMLAARANPGVSRLAQYFNEHSLVSAHGRNIVNVILVDFRGFDTLGETSVLGIAGLGIYALLKLRPKKKRGDNASVTDS